MAVPLTGAIDLSQLGKTPAPLPEGQFVCEVEDGCGLRCRGEVPHSSLKDCLKTTLPYVELYLTMREEVQHNFDVLGNEIDRLDVTNQTLLRANQQLVAENDRMKAELQASKNNTTKKIEWTTG